MTNKEIKDFSKRITALIATRRLRDAIAEMKAMARRRMAWEVGDRIDTTEQSYIYMLRYVAQGAVDPERNSVYDSILAELYGELDMLVLYMEKIDNPSQYHSMLRLFERSPKADRIAGLLAAYAQLQGNMSILSMLTGVEPTPEQKANRQRMELTQADLFTAIWATPWLSSSDSEALLRAIESDEHDANLKTHIISALMLGLLQVYDERKLELLMRAYMTSPADGSQAVAAAKLTSAALVGMLLGLWKYRDRPMPKRLQALLAAVKETPTWGSDLRTAFIELIRARDTERINRKIRDEVIPDMMRLRPDILNKVNDGAIDPNDFAAMQENPEWQDLLDKSGITDKLKELTEMQLEGSDVMMSTFSHLKNFPFFSTLSNWLLPFSSTHTQLVKDASQMGPLADMLEHSMMLCDNDKYSFVLAISMVPPEQRELMTSQFRAQSESMYEAMAEAANAIGPELRRKTVNLYVQNIYRFFKLYRRRDEFYDPFETGANLISVPALASDFGDSDLLQVVAEFYFKLGYMRDALDVFARLEEIVPGDAQRNQKIGYAYEHLKEHERAIEYYQRAELLDSSSVWTMRRLAACYRAIGKPDEAIRYYKQIAALRPDDYSVALLLGYAYMEEERYDEALKQFYKVEFLDDKSTKAWRPLAWVLFLTRDFEGAKKYYSKIAADSPTATDYLNMGHVSLATGDIGDAVNDYELSVQQGGGDREAFMDMLNADMAALESVGVDKALIPIVADAVFYKLQK